MYLYYTFTYTKIHICLGDVDISILRKVLLAKYPDILGLHEVHVWTFTPGELVLSAHIKYRNKQVADMSSSKGCLDTCNFFKKEGSNKIRNDLDLGGGLAIFSLKGSTD